MALNETQQVSEHLQRCQQPLIVLRKDWNPDAVGSASALFSALVDMGKKPEIICQDFVPASHLDFLPHQKDIRPEISALRKFVISIDTAKSKIGELSYEAVDGFLHIYLTPKTGNLEAAHVKTSSTDYRHDLIITIDTPDLASLGPTLDSAADFFFRTPIINFDHSPANELYGQVNYIDTKATSVGELLYALLKEMKHPIREDVATSLLTGIIYKTKSFKSGALTPQALTVASELVALGAKRDLIVSNLYRTKTIPVLKLWGRALARMKYDPTLKIVSTVLTHQDFILAGAEDKDLPDLLHELIAASPEAETSVLIYELHDGTICCIIRNEHRRIADQLSAPWNGEGDNIQSRCFMKGKSIVEVEQEVLNHLRATLKAGVF